MKQGLILIGSAFVALILSNCTTKNYYYVPIHDAGYYGTQADRDSQLQDEMPPPPEDGIEQAANNYIEESDSIDPLDQAALAHMESSEQVESSTVEYHYHEHNHYHPSPDYYSDYNPWGYPYYVTDRTVVYQPYSPVVYYNYWYYDYYPYTTAAIHHNPFWGTPYYGYYFGSYYSYPYGISIAYSSWPYHWPYYHRPYYSSFWWHSRWNSRFYWRNYWKKHHYDRQYYADRYSRPQTRSRRSEERMSPTYSKSQEARRKNVIQPIRRNSSYTQRRSQESSATERNERATVQRFQRPIISSFFEDGRGLSQQQSARSTAQSSPPRSSRSSNVSSNQRAPQTETRQEVYRTPNVDNNMFPERRPDTPQPRYYQSNEEVERRTATSESRTPNIEAERRPNTGSWTLRTQVQAPSYSPLRDSRSSSSSRFSTPPSRTFSAPRGSSSPFNSIRSSPSSSSSRTQGTSSFRSSPTRSVAPRTSAPRSSGSFSSPRTSRSSSPATSPARSSSSSNSRSRR